MTSGSAKKDAEKSAPDIVGLTADARLRGTAVTLAAAVRSGGVTTAMTYDVRVGTSIWDRAERTSRSPSTNVRLLENAAMIRQTLEGMCVKTMVLIRPKCFPNRAATGYEKAARTFDQKKKALAAASERSKRSKSHNASSDCTVKPPANESRLNSAASLYTVRRDGPSALGSDLACVSLLRGNRA